MEDNELDGVLLTNEKVINNGWNESTVTIITEDMLRPYQIIGSAAFAGMSNIISVQIPSTILEIRDGTFSECNNLKTVSIGSNVNTIGESAFRNCTSLKSITIPNNVGYIGDNIFQGCTSLTSVTLSNVLTTIPNYAFDGCSNLANITIPSSVTIVGDGAFRGCAFTNFLLPTNVTSIGDESFANCSELYVITTYDTLEHIGTNAFSGCDSLNTISGIQYAGKYAVKVLDKELSSYSLGSGTRWIGDNLFEDCTNLESFIIPDTVIQVGKSAFHNCTKLSSITFGSALKTIGACAFQNCVSLPNIVIPGTVEVIGDYAFLGCVEARYIKLCEEEMCLPFTTNGFCAILGDGDYLDGDFMPQANQERNYKIGDIIYVTGDNGSQEEYGGFPIDSELAVASEVDTPSTHQGEESGLYQDIDGFFHGIISDIVWEKGKYYKVTDIIECYSELSGGMVQVITYEEVTPNIRDVGYSAFSHCISYSQTADQNNIKKYKAKVTTSNGLCYVNGKSKYAEPDDNNFYGIKNQGYATADGIHVIVGTDNIKSVSGVSGIKYDIDDVNINLHLSNFTNTETEITIVEGDNTHKVSVYKAPQEYKAYVSHDSLVKVLGIKETDFSSEEGIHVRCASSNISINSGYYDKLDNEIVFYFNAFTRLETSITMQVGDATCTLIIYNSNYSGTPSSGVNWGGIEWIDLEDWVRSRWLSPEVVDVEEDDADGKVTIPSTVRNIGDLAFEGCYKLTTFVVDNNNNQYSVYNNSLYDKTQTEIICCPITKTGAYTLPNTVKVIDVFAFSRCSKLTRVDVPNSVTTIHMHAFAGCTLLDDLKIGSTTYGKRLVSGGAVSNAYKAMPGDMTCHSFTYSQGSTYNYDDYDPDTSVELCDKGFHACLRLCDVFNYYGGTIAPTPTDGNKFKFMVRQVNLDGVSSETNKGDSKVVAEEIYIGSRIL